MKKRQQKIHRIPLNELALLMAEQDNVAIAKREIRQGTVISYSDGVIRISDVIPKGHRFSLSDIGKGGSVIQYGYPFGISKGIKKGRIISKYNTSVYRDGNYETMIEAAFSGRKAVVPSRVRRTADAGRTFMGFVRGNGQVGTRNYYLVVPTSLCASDVAVKIAGSLDNNKLLKKKYKNIDGIVAAAHTEGCGCNDGEIVERLMLTLKNTLIHSNVGGALIIDLGCEKTNLEFVSKHFGGLSKYGKPVDFISIQELGGTGRALAQGEKIVRRRLQEVNCSKREEVSIKYLIIGTECGASDSFSGITANPLIGRTVDGIICSGGSAILSETPEMLGAGKILMERMLSRKVAEKFANGVNYYKSLANKLNVSMDGNFVAGNEAGGLVNLTLKSLGAVLKGGNTRIVDFLNYAERTKRQGLSIMNGPGNDLESMTGIAASGANIILFSTGMGTTEGNLIVPVVKIPTRTEIYKRMKEDMDFNAGRLLDEDISMDELSDELLELVIKVASGQRTWAEKWEKHSFQIWTAGKLSL